MASPFELGKSADTSLSAACARNVGRRWGKLHPKPRNVLIALFQVQFYTETPIRWYHLAPSQYDGNS